MSSSERSLGIWSLCEKHMERPFLIDAAVSRTYTYAEFFNAVCGLVSVLQQQGVKAGDRIAVLMPNCAEYVAAYFAGLSMGYVLVPISIHLPSDDIQFLLQHCGAQWLAVSPATPPLPSTAGLPTLTLGGDDWTLEQTAVGAAVSGEWADTERDGLATIHFTSGTTERPKGVAHRLRSLIGSAVDFNEMLGFGTHTRLYHLLSMAHMAGFLNSLLCPFLSGGSVVVGRTFGPQLLLTFWDAPREYGVNTLWIAPAIAASLVRLDRDAEGQAYSRDHIDAVCVGTAPLSSGTKVQFEEKYGVELLESYGLSETLFNATNSPRYPHRSGSVGKVLASTQVSIRDDDDGERPRGEEGEIHLHTPYAMVGYLDYATGEPVPSTSPEWFCTGDVGIFDEDGYLFITGRKKDLIIRGGVNVSPRRVERVAEGHAAVQQAAVVGVPDPFWGEAVVAVVLLRPGTALGAVQDELTEMCRERLAPSEQPSRWLQFDELPLSSTGKVQKARLREIVAEQLHSRRDAS